MTTAALSVAPMDFHDDTDENCWLRANFAWLMRLWLALPRTKESFYDFACETYDREREATR